MKTSIKVLFVSIFALVGGNVYGMEQGIVKLSISNQSDYAYDFFSETKDDSVVLFHRRILEKETDQDLYLELAPYLRQIYLYSPLSIVQILFSSDPRDNSFIAIQNYTRENKKYQTIGEFRNATHVHVIISPDGSVQAVDRSGME